MIPGFSFLNFDPSQELEGQAQRLMEVFHEMCPSESSITASCTKLKDAYVCQIQVQGDAVKASIEERSPDAWTALQRAHEKILETLSKWHEEREITAFTKRPGT